MDMMKKVPVREQDPKVRATNFDEDVYKRQPINSRFSFFSSEKKIVPAESRFRAQNSVCIMTKNVKLLHTRWKIMGTVHIQLH